MDSQFRCADFDDVARPNAAGTDLPAPVDHDRLATQRRDTQPADRARRHYGVAKLDSRRGKLQMLAGRTADREPARVDENAASFSGGLAK
jgi:hypothetical protein